MLACALLVSACGRRDVTVNTPDGQVKISADGTGSTFTIKGPKGEVITGDAKTGQFVAKTAEGQVVASGTPGGQGNITFKGKEGQGTFQAGDAVSIPKTFPKDAPIYPGAKITAALDSPQGQQIQFTSKDPMKKLSDFYSDKLTKDGWAQQAMVQADNTFTLSSKKENRVCTIILSKNDEEVLGILTVNKE